MLLGLFAALAFAMWHLLSMSFGKGCRRAGTALAPSMSPKLGKGPLDEEREGGGGMQARRGEAENAAS